MQTQRPNTILNVMKKTVACFLCACLLLLFCPSVGAAEERAVAVGSREDLQKIAAHPDGCYELTDDIDMSGEDWLPIPFSGTLNGNGHTIFNLTVHTPGVDTVTTYDGNRIEYETVLGGLFSAVTDAEIRDLELLNAVVDVETDRHCFIGAFAGYAVSSVFSGCSVTCRNRLTISSVNAGVGGMVGFAIDNTFTKCTVDAELIFTDVNPDTMCEEFLGGVYTCGCSDVKDSSVRVRGFAEIYGYAHNGGAAGMIKLPRGNRSKYIISGTVMDAEISFFEMTRARRAYCDPWIGENRAGECRLSRNQVAHYQQYESRTPVRLSPEQCEAPRYSSEITQPTCTEWGYTTYTCAGCGCSYRDHYTHPEHLYAETRIEPGCTEDGSVTYTCSRCGQSVTNILPAAGHVPGAFTETVPPTYESEGEEQQVCEICGAVLKTRPVPALPLIPAERVQLSETELTLRHGEQVRLTAAVFPENATDPEVRYSSSDEAVAQVRQDGAVTAGKSGTAKILCQSADGHAESVCTVTVSFSVWQWIRYYILFGWTRDR